MLHSHSSVAVALSSLVAVVTLGSDCAYVKVDLSGLLTSFPLNTCYYNRNEAGGYTATKWECSANQTVAYQNYYPNTDCSGGPSSFMAYPIVDGNCQGTKDCAIVVQHYTSDIVLSMLHSILVCVCDDWRVRERVRENLLHSFVWVKWHLIEVALASEWMGVMGDLQSGASPRVNWKPATAQNILAMRF